MKTALVEGHPDLVRDTQTKAVLAGPDMSAYERHKRRQRATAQSRVEIDRLRDRNDDLEQRLARLESLIVDQEQE